MQGSLSTGNWTGDLTFDVDPAELVRGQDLEIGLLDTVAPSVGLDLLEIRVALNGAPVTDLSFSDTSLAEAELHDKLITIDGSQITLGQISEVAVSLE
jgi:hypothetical protein